MDVYEAKKALEKQTTTDTTRQPLVSAAKHNAVTTTRRPRIREISSRYKSPPPSGPRRCPSPTITRTIPSNSQVVPNRAVSAERKRPSTPTSPACSSTPARDSSIDLPVSSRRPSTGRLPESLWPSTMRSLNVSFQSDAVSIPVSKKEKPVNTLSVDRTLRPSSNVAHRQGETPSVSRKPTPERKRSPLKGKNASDRSENSKPVDSSRSRLIDQRRWPSRIGVKANSNLFNKSLDLSDKSVRGSSSPAPSMGLSWFRKMPMSLSDCLSKPLPRSSSDTPRVLSPDETSGSGSPTKSEDDNPIRASGRQKLLSASSLDRSTLADAVSRLHSLPSSRSRPASPSRTTLPNSRTRPASPSRTMILSSSRPASPSRASLSSSLSSSIARGMSPSHARPTTPPSRGVSPSRIRQSSITSTQSSSSTTSVLSFIADVKKGKKGASYIEDAHQLRLLYNRLLQWRFTNARAEAVIYIQKITAEESLYNVWNTTSDLQDLVTFKRISLQQLKLEMKLNSILNDQIKFLEDWAGLERDHISSLAGAIEDLQANTLRLPVTGGAMADIKSLKAVISSAVYVMQSMGASIRFLLSKVEKMNSLVSELAVVATQEKSMFDKCEDLLASTAALQIEETSLRTHLIQMKQEVSEDIESPPILPVKRFPWP